jgi:chromosome segregation ATPase
LQLRVWKELAISKQMLMRAATDALKLDPDCTQEELKLALELAVKRASQADVAVATAQEQAKAAVAAVERKLADAERAQKTAEARMAEALANHKKLDEQVAEMRARNAEVANEFKVRFAEKERELKAITAALSDSPENVLKKLKTLTKEKRDEADARKQAEETANTLLKDKKKLEQTVKEMQTAQDNAVKLAGAHRELHTLCGTLRDQLVPLAADAKSIPAVPALDTALLEGIEKAGAAEEKKPGAKGKR